MLERDLEGVFRRGVKALGGVVIKGDSSANVGVPDRVVVLPGQRWFAVELKTVTGTCSPAQLNYHRRLLAATGVAVVVLHGAAEVRAWLRTL